MSILTNPLKKSEKFTPVLSQILKLSEQSSIQILKATSSSIQLIKTFEAQSQQTFKIFTVIESSTVNYCLQMSLNDNLLKTAIKQIGQFSLLNRINGRNMQEQNNYTLIWDDEKSEIIMRAFTPRTMKDTHPFRCVLKKYFDSFVSFVIELLPAPKKQIWQQKHEQMSQALSKKIQEWKQNLKKRKSQYLKRANKQNKGLSNPGHIIPSYFQIQKLLEKENDSANRLIQMIQITQKEQSEVDCPFIGKYCDLHIFHSTYFILKNKISINKVTNKNAIQNNNLEELMEKVEGDIVQKKSLYWDTEHFDREKKMLLYLRNIKCHNLASYYFQYREEVDEAQVQQFYMPKYPSNLHENTETNKKFQMMTDLAKGIHYLYRMGILHRDLKPRNVVLTEDLSPKIIDFGSSIENHFQNFLKIGNSSVITTKKYNILWSKVPAQIQKLIPQQQFNRHPKFDVHGLGKIIEQTLKTYKTQSKIGKLLSEHIEFLIKQCTAHNPDERLYPIQIIAFLQLFIAYQRNSLIVY